MFLKKWKKEWMGLAVGILCMSLPHLAQASFTLKSELTDPQAAVGEGFGASVSVDGDTAVVGIPDGVANSITKGIAFVYTLQNDGTWNYAATLAANDGVDGDQFGSSVSISGSTIVVGAPLSPLDASDPFNPVFGPGAVYVFTGSGSSWTQQKKLTDGSGSNGDAFGHAVSVDESTGVIAVSSVFQGGLSFNQMPKVFVYTGSGSSWTLAGTLTEPSGIAGSDFGISVSVNGTSIAVGDDNVDGSFTSAKSFVFTTTGNDWTSPSSTTLDYPGNSGESFGFSISLNGSTLLVGAPQIHGIGNGSAYIFTKSGSSWSLSNGGNALSPNDGVNDDVFGGSVAVDETAKLALVGAPGKNSLKGVVYVFSSTDGSTWTQSESLDAGVSATIGAGFGDAVSLNGTTNGTIALIGAPGTDVNNTPQGAAYAFEGPAIVPSTYTISVTTTGLPDHEQVVLQNVIDGGDTPEELTMTEDESASFSTPLTSGQTYAVTVKTQPDTAECDVTSGSGTVESADVSLTVTCVPTHLIFVNYLPTDSTIHPTIYLYIVDGQKMGTFDYTGQNVERSFDSRVREGTSYFLYTSDFNSSYSMNCQFSDGDGNSIGAHIGPGVTGASYETVTRQITSDVHIRVSCTATSSPGGCSLFPTGGSQDDVFATFSILIGSLALFGVLKTKMWKRI